MNVTSIICLSLKQDACFLNELLEEIIHTYEIKDLKSWLFPTKSQDIVSQLILENSIYNASYEKCLEVTLDRLYVLINSFIWQIQNFKPLYTKQRTGQRTTDKLSLGLCVKLLWEHISDLKDIHQQQETTPNYSENHIIMDKQSQTEVIALNMCDSCSTAILCMKRLLNAFESQQEIIKIKYQIFDITQFGCMLKVTSSIEDTVNKFYKKFHEEKLEKDRFKLENKELNIEIQKRKARIAFLEEEVEILRADREKASQEIFALKQEQSNLSKNIFFKEKTIKSTQKSLKNLNVFLESIINKKEILENENKVLKINLDKCMQLLTKGYKQIVNKQLKINEEFNVIKEIIEQYKNYLKNVNNKLIAITTNIGKVNMKLKQNYDGIEKVFRGYFKCEKSWEKIKDCFKTKLEERNKPILDEPHTPFINGNPIEDISKQIEENKTKIENFKNENVRLEKLLYRFKQVKIFNPS